MPSLALPSSRGLIFFLRHSFIYMSLPLFAGFILFGLLFMVLIQLASEDFRERNDAEEEDNCQLKLHGYENVGSNL